jgi:hypothetical protein
MKKSVILADELLVCKGFTNGNGARDCYSENQVGARFFNFLMGISNFSLENRGAMMPLMEVENS